jgi:CubicO group peptidase (beta-lactamase class C family)
MRMSEVPIGGFCAPRFEAVRTLFRESFSKGEVGASVAVVLDGDPVVDLWGGHADRERVRPWERDTLANVYSTTKGMTALCAQRLVDEGRLDLDAPVARYWPEFAQAGKERIPVRDLLCHRAGVAAFPQGLRAEQELDWKTLCSALAAQPPLWEPGTRHGYHAEIWWARSCAASTGARSGAFSARKSRRRSGRTSTSVWPRPSTLAAPS